MTHLQILSEVFEALNFVAPFVAEVDAGGESRSLTLRFELEQVEQTLIGLGLKTNPFHLLLHCFYVPQPHPRKKGKGLSKSSGMICYMTTLSPNKFKNR